MYCIMIFAGNWTNKLREILTVLYSHYNLDVKSDVQEDVRMDQNTKKMEGGLDGKPTRSKKDAHPYPEQEKKGEQELDFGAKGR